jgi:hypothetical protein
MSEKSWVPKGYSVVEMALPDVMAQAIGEGNALVWKKPVIGERFCGEEATETSTRDYAHYYYPVIVPTTPPAPQYREPTAADVGKMVEVRSACFPWIEGSRELLAVLPIDLNQRFICRNRMYPNNVNGYDYARIKIEESK